MRAKQTTIGVIICLTFAIYLFRSVTLCFIFDFVCLLNRRCLTFVFSSVSGKWWFRMGRLLRKHQVWIKMIVWLKLLYCKIRKHFVAYLLNTNLSLSHCRLRKINTYSDSTPQVLIAPKNRQSLKLCFEIIPFRMSAQSLLPFSSLVFVFFKAASG